MLKQGNTHLLAFDTSILGVKGLNSLSTLGDVWIIISPKSSST